MNSKTWPIVLAFARIMEAKLEENRHKGDREGWLRDEVTALLDRLKEETEELERAIRRSSAGDGLDEVAREAADVANFAMMIADLAIDLSKYPKPPDATEALLKLDRHFADRLGRASIEKQGTAAAPLTPMQIADRLIERIEAETAEAQREFDAALSRARTGAPF